MENVSRLFLIQFSNWFSLKNLRELKESFPGTKLFVIHSNIEHWKELERFKRSKTIWKIQQFQNRLWLIHSKILSLYLFFLILKKKICHSCSFFFKKCFGWVYLKLKISKSHFELFHSEIMEENWNGKTARVKFSKILDLLRNARVEIKTDLFYFSCLRLPLSTWSEKGFILESARN